MFQQCKCFWWVSTGEEQPGKNIKVTSNITVNICYPLLISIGLIPYLAGEVLHSIKGYEHKGNVCKTRSITKLSHYD